MRLGGGCSIVALIPSFRLLGEREVERESVQRSKRKEKRPARRSFGVDVGAQSTSC